MTDVLEIKGGFPGAEVKAIGDEGLFEGIFSTFGVVDEHGDVIHKGAFRKSIQERGPARIKVLYIHDFEKPIGVLHSIEETDQHLVARGKIALDSFWGREAWTLMKAGVLNEGSIGFIPVKVDWGQEENGRTVRHIREVKLIEVSPVPIGANPITAVQAVKDGIREMLFTKGAIPPHRTPKAPEDMEWDAAAVLRELPNDAKVLRMVHAWYDENKDPDTKAAYKLPHHLPDGRVVLRGVMAAGAALMGARGGVKIPAGDLPGVRKHLEVHYHQFGRKAPWEEKAGLPDLVESMQALWSAIKNHEALVTADPRKRQRVADALERALDLLARVAVEPGAEDAHHSALLTEQAKAALAMLDLELETLKWEG